ncbi:MAG TPA: rRNA maturation RNase YbeY [Verrucomicrobiae bacterium]|nr:rRNA maturation RNase YbeY [Verrucomicrobiae bacterium]
MALTFALTERDAEQIGSGSLQPFIEGYDEAFPDLSFLVDVALIDREQMQLLNKQQRDIDEPTDVLSFPTFPDFETLREHARQQPTLLGSIVICPEKAEEYQESLIQLVHHGLLHLLCYDHETDFAAWISEERRILEVLAKHSLHIPPVPYESI